MGSLTVLIASHNPGEYLLPALDSIRNQSFRDWKMVFVDDCSTDGSLELVRSLCREEPRIRLICNERNLGLSASLNRGLEETSTQWVARMDADDISHPERFARQMEVLRRDPELVLVTSYIDTLRGDKVERGPRGIGRDFALLPWFLTFYNRIGGHGQVVYSADAVRSVGGYNEQNRPSQDRELWPKLIRCGRFELVREPLYVWRWHARSLTNSKRERHAAESIAVDRNEILERCGIEVSLEDAWLLRDFWLRFDTGHAHWDRIQALLLQCAHAFNRSCPLPGGEAALRRTIAQGWLSLALRAMRGGSRAAVCAHLRRACDAGGWGMGAVAVKFACRLAALRGRADRLI